MSETTARALRLLDLLQTHRHWSGPELVGRLGITARTLRRDVERLRGLGYRIDSTPGAAGGYRLEAGSALPPLLFTDDEAVTMAIGLRLAATQGLVDGEHTTLTALAKLEQVLPSALRERVRALSGSVTPHGRSREPVPTELLAQVALACRDSERLRFRYVSAAGDETERLVEPHSLVAAARSWFLVAWDVRREDWRTFRVDRMTEPFPTRVRVPRRELPTADAAEYVQASISAAAAERERPAELVLRMPIAEMREYFGAWSRGAREVDAERTAWPVHAETPELVVASAVWAPAGVPYEIETDAETRAAIHEIAVRLAAATAPESTGASAAGEGEAAQPRGATTEAVQPVASRS
jgi:predicted DNA-binding transcriptional regulator YafY